MRYRLGFSQRQSARLETKRPSGLYFAKNKSATHRVSAKPSVSTQRDSKAKSGFKQTLAKLIVILFGVGIFFVAIGMVVLSLYLKNLEKALPDPNKLIERDTQLSTQIFDRNGSLLYTFYGDENREFVKLDEIPAHLKWAILSAEDIGFYQHKGIDVLGLTRAVLQRIGLLEGYSGASTITQQLVKKTLQSDAVGTELNSLDELQKVQQILLSLQVEQKFTKDEILQLYMNEIFMGGVNYGFQSASKAYFGKDVRKLTLAESALLAGLIQAPGTYAPLGGTNPEMAKIRQTYVLDQMLKHKDLTGVTEEEINKAREEKLVYKAANVNIKAPHFVFYIKKQLDEMYGPDRVISGGYKVTTSLDYSIQKLAEQEIKSGIAKYGKKWNVNNGAMVAIDPKTGDILAMVGSIDYNSKNPKIDGNVNVTLSPRQMGSSVKPYTYLTAFSQGYGPWLETPDILMNFGNYKLANWDNKYYGPMTARQALIQSRNIPAVYTMQLIGLENFMKTAQTFGITTLTKTSDYGLSLTLGAAEMQLLEHAGAYTVFANGGIKKDYRSILEIKDSGGNVVLAKKENKGKRVWDEKEVYMLNWILCDLGGFGDQPMKENYNLNGKRTFCGKTGTTNGPRDLTSMMYTKSLVVGFWAGNNDNTETPGAWSTTVPLPMAGSFMTKMASKYKPEPFNRPSGVVAGTVCNDTGQLATKNSGCKKVPTIYITGKAPKNDEREKLYICKDNGKVSTNENIARANNLGVDKYLLKKEMENKLQQISYEKFMKKSYLFEKPESAECKLPIGSDGAPTVAISSPNNGETIYPSSTLNIQASANSGATITKVEFLFDGSLVGTDNDYPYSVQYAVPGGISAGLHNITAIVYDSNGKTGSNTINVVASGSTISVSITSPVVNTSSPVTFTAATIGVGVSRVDYVVTSTGYSKVFSSTNSMSAWSASSSDFLNGNHDYTIIAYAYKGASIFTSNPVNIKINK